MPVTTVVALPYVLLYLPLALYFDNPSTGYVVSTLAWALLGASTTELVAWGVSRRRSAEVRWEGFERRAELCLRLGLLTSAIGALSALAGAWQGNGTIFTQVNGGGASGVLGAITLFSSWLFLGVTLLVGAHLGGRLTRRRLFLLLAILVACELVRAAVTTITNQAVAFVAFAALILLYTGVLRVKEALTLVLVVLLAWPTVYNLRNELRVSGGVAVGGVSAVERLRFDQQITRGQVLPPGIELGQPRGLELLRYGVIPGPLDSGRPPLTVASDINVALGGSRTSSYNFLPVATQYVLEGPRSVAVFYAAVATLLAVLLRGGRRLGPGRLAVLGLVVAYALAWFATYPSNVIGFLQALVAAVPVALVFVVDAAMREKRWRRTRDTGRSASRGPRDAVGRGA